MNSFFAHLLQSEVAATWATAFGSVAAVVVALWLAGKATKAKLTCQCNISNLSESEYGAFRKHVHGQLIKLPEQLKISVFNAGPAPVIVYDILMQVGFNKTCNPIFADNFDAEHCGNQYDLNDAFNPVRANLHCFPVRLGCGEFSQWSIILGKGYYPDYPWIDRITENFVQTKWDAKTFRFVIYTNQGRKKIVPRKDVLARIADEWA